MNRLKTIEENYIECRGAYWAVKDILRESKITGKAREFLERELGRRERALKKATDLHSQSIEY